MRFLCFILLTCIILSACVQTQHQISNNLNLKNTDYAQEPQVANLDNKRISSSGTGFIVTNDGYIFTCYHVIKDAKDIQIAIGGKKHPAKLIREDPINDLALLKINGLFPALAFASEGSAKMGQEVFTIGYPNIELQGVNAKFTKGTISSLSGFRDDTRFFQISAPIQLGNSGGGLLDEKGEVIGIVVSRLDSNATFKTSGSIPQNVNYAIKAIYAKAMLCTLPEIYEKLIIPQNSESNVIDKVLRSTVLVLCF